MSLDVALGSGLLSLAIAKYYLVPLPVSVVLALMIAVWVIYTFDHLTDAKKIGRQASTYRHRYHQQHYKIIRKIFFLVMLTSQTVVLAIPTVVLKWGFLCSIGVLFYFLLLRLKGFWCKELIIATCYTIGVFLAPLSLSPTSLNLFQLLLIPQVFFLALANLIIFSYFDYEKDQQDGQHSLALYLGLLPTRKIALGLTLFNLFMIAMLSFFAKLFVTQEVQGILFSMNLLLFILLLKERHFRKHELYRIIGDGIFFVPILFLLG